MQKYKVIALSVGGLGKNIYESGDIVTAQNFPEGAIKRLIDGDFIEIHKMSAAEKKAAEKSEKEAKEEAKKEAELAKKLELEAKEREGALAAEKKAAEKSEK